MDSGPAAKRPRYDAGYGNGNGNYESVGARGPSTGQKPYEEHINIPPSPVIQVKFIPEAAVQDDIYQAASRFGTVKAIMMLSKHEALVEFMELEAAIHAVKTGSMPIHGGPVELSYSTNQKIGGAAGDVEDIPKESNVLLISISNAVYPIDVDVIHKITTPHGNVLRIVVFRKVGIQAMVEFDTIASAMTAKINLNGADIYSGCCTLKIECAKPQPLVVLRNDKESWDYTRNDLPGPDIRPPPLLQRPDVPPGPQSSSAYSEYNTSGNYSGGGGGHYAEPPRQGFVDRPQQQGNYDRSYPYGDHRRSSPPPTGGYSGYNNDRGGREYDRPPRDSHYDSYGSRQESRDQYGPPGNSGRESDRYSNDRRYDDRSSNSYDSSQQAGGVAMLYGLHPEKMNCDRLFNLFCLYGNVARIKFLKTKEGSAMIQLSDPNAMHRAIEQLNGIYIFGNKIQVASSRQVSLNEVPNPFPLPDGTPSFKEYISSRNNRFSTPELASKNRVTPPTRCLHFFNAPAGATEEEVLEVFTKNGTEKPQITIIQGKSERSTSGFVEWETMEAAVEALIVANHTEMANKKVGHPYLFKVCFTQPGRPPQSQGPPRDRRP